MHWLLFYFLIDRGALVSHPPLVAFDDKPACEAAAAEVVDMWTGAKNGFPITYHSAVTRCIRQNTPPVVKECFVDGQSIGKAATCPDGSTETQGKTP